MMMTILMMMMMMMMVIVRRMPKQMDRTIYKTIADLPNQNTLTIIFLNIPLPFYFSIVIRNYLFVTSR